jgi:hypothetical protein
MRLSVGHPHGFRPALRPILRPSPRPILRPSLRLRSGGRLGRLAGRDSRWGPRTRVPDPRFFPCSSPFLSRFFLGIPSFTGSFVDDAQRRCLKLEGYNLNQGMSAAGCSPEPARSRNERGRDCQ